MMSAEDQSRASPAHPTRSHRDLTLKHRKRRNRDTDKSASSSCKGQTRQVMLPLLGILSFVFVRFEMKQLRTSILPALSSATADESFRNLYSYGASLWNGTHFDWNMDDILGNWTFLWNTDFSTSAASTTASTAEQQKRRHDAFLKVPLVELVQPDAPVTCPGGLAKVDSVVNTTAEALTDRKIPRIVHQTGKTRCLTAVFTNAINKWKFPGYSYYFHDDDAVNRLFDKEWPMFPQLKNTLSCMQGKGGAATADLWRYLALWEYGGIYTDMDCQPNNLLQLGNAIQPEMDAFFLQEGGGFLSQYFFAVAPHHPLMYLAVTDVLHEMHSLDDTGNFYVPVVTGPGALKRAFLKFMGTTKANGDENCRKYCKPSRGHYVGIVAPNWTVDVLSTRFNHQEFVIRDAISGFQKRQQWNLMGAKDYDRNPGNKRPVESSCWMHLHDRYQQERVTAEKQIARWRRQLI